MDVNCLVQYFICENPGYFKNLTEIILMLDDKMEG